MNYFVEYMRAKAALRIAFIILGVMVLAGVIVRLAELLRKCLSQMPVRRLQKAGVVGQQGGGLRGASQTGGRQWARQAEGILYEQGGEALRAHLGHDLGLSGRVRALWALPPRRMRPMTSGTRRLN